MNEKTCGNCKFAVDILGEENVATCRFNPPTLMYQPMPGQRVVGAPPSVDWNMQASAFPMVKKTNWCGQHQPAPSAIFNS